MARVILAMDSSSITRCGFLLLSAITRGTALGSGPLKTFRFPAPGVVRLAATSGFVGDGLVFMETGTLALSATFTSGELFEADCPTVAEELGGVDGGVPLFAVCRLEFAAASARLGAWRAVCLGWGYFSISCAADIESVGRFSRRAFNA